MKNGGSNYIVRAESGSCMLLEDNCVLSLCGGESSLIFYMGRAMIRACAIDGEFYTAVNEENELLGYCLWMPPKKTIYST